MMIVKSETGTELHHFWGLQSLYTPDPSIPLTHTIIAARYADHWLMIYNKRRNSWELPGGGIMPGESPVECARRELCEESSQVADEMHYRGRFLIRLVDGSYEYGMLYQTELEDLYPFTINEETTQLRLVPCTYTEVDAIDEYQSFMFAQCYDAAAKTA
jgi:8-oxo-dGTP diphosphatase